MMTSAPGARTNHSCEPPRLFVVEVARRDRELVRYQQTMDGFGASSAFFGQSLTTDQADQLFDPKKGIGLSLLRTMIGVPADTMTDGTEPTTGADPTPTAPELTTAQQAAVRGCQVWAAAWTPPPIWKTTNSKNGSEAQDGGIDFATNKLDPSHYPDFATYLTQYVDILAAANPPVPVLGVSPANEPDYVATWDSAQWTAEELTTFIGQYMAPAFAQKYPQVKIIAPETAGCPGCDPYITSLLANSAAASAVSIMAAHGYEGPMGNYHKPQNAGKQFWETEWSQENSKGDTPDPSMTSALVMAQRMHGDLVTTGMTAWNWWAIYITADGLNDNTRLNPAFIQPDATGVPRTCSSAGTRSGTGPSSFAPGSSGSTLLTIPTMASTPRRTATRPTWRSSPSTPTPAPSIRSSSSTATRSPRSRRGSPRPTQRQPGRQERRHADQWRLHVELPARA